MDTKSKELKMFAAGKGAFTLVELLVSITILSLLLVMLAQVYDMSSRTLRTTTSAMQSFDDVRAILFSMRKDFVAATFRTNTDRTLGLLVEDPSGLDVSGMTVDKLAAFTFPDEKVKTFGSMSFITHCVYYWSRERGELYRAYYDTSVYTNVLMSPAVAVAVDGNNTNANQNRLRNITLAYSTTDWVGSSEMLAAMATATNLPVLRNVFDIEFRSHNNSSGTSYATNWLASQGLPVWMEIRLGVCRDQDRPLFLRQATNGGVVETNRLQYFHVSVPFPNRGVRDNRIY